MQRDDLTRLAFVVDLAGMTVFAAAGALAAILGAVTCFALRLASLWQHWRLPHLS